MKKLLVAFVLFLLPATTQASFGDVTGNHVNFEAVGYVKAQNIVSGYPDGSFRPDGLINRAELAKILVAANFDESLIASCKLDQMGL